jgi:hypothetical protein
MATADHKAFDAHPVRSVTIQESPRWRPYSPKRRAAPPFVPWFKLAEDVPRNVAIANSEACLGARAQAVKACH